MASGTQNCFSPSPAQTSIPMLVWLSGHVYNPQDSLQAWDVGLCCIIPLLYLHPMVCPEICYDFLGYDIKIYHNLPSARQCFALPRLYWLICVWVWAWPYCRLAEVGMMLEQQECWNGEGEGHGEQVLYIQGEQVCPKMGTSPGSSQALLTRVCGMDLCKADPSPLSINTDTGCAAFSGQATHLPPSWGRRHQPHPSPTLQCKLSLITCPMQSQQLLRLF